MRKPLLARRRSPRSLAGCASTPPPPPQLDLPAATAGDLQLDRWWTAFGDPTLDTARRRGARATTSTSRRRSRASSTAARWCCSRSPTCIRPSISPPARRAHALDAGRLQSAAVRLLAVRDDLAVGLQASYEARPLGQVPHRDRGRAGRPAGDRIRARDGAHDGRRRHRALLLQPSCRRRAAAAAAGHAEVARRDASRCRRTATRPASSASTTCARPRPSARPSRATSRSRGAPSPNSSRRSRCCSDARRGKCSRRRSRATCEIVRLTAVPTLPSGVPSDMLARRPDIRRAEAQLAAANLRIDVARADYYPAISLTGNYGTQAGALKNLFTGPGVVWGLARVAAAAADRPQGDRSQRRGADGAPQRARRHSTRRRCRARSATRTTRCRRTTRRARRWPRSTERRGQAAAGARAVRPSLHAGYSPYLEVLDAQRQLLQAQTLQIIAARNVRLSLVDFAKAVGGGWDYKTAVRT